MNDTRKASDELLLQMIREGKHDAEIAVRLGVTTGDLRGRKADLRNRLGDERYQQLAGLARPAPRSGRAKFALWGAGVAAGTLAILLGVANIFAGQVEDSQNVIARLVATPEPRTLSTPKVVTIDGQEFEDLGGFILLAESTAGGIGAIHNRAALSAVELRRKSFIGSSEFVEWEVVSSSRTDAFLRGTVGNRQLDAAIYTQRPEGRLRPLASGVGLLFEVEAFVGYPKPPTIMVRVTEGGEPVEARLSDDGRLLVARARMDRSAVLDRDTGERIDVSEAQRFGMLALTPTGRAENICDGPPPNPTGAPGYLDCQVAWTRGTRGFITPADGTYSCTGARSVRFEAEGIRLEFILSGVSPTANFACEARPVSSGSSIVSDGEWFISAVSADGRRIPVAVSGDGQLYVGTLRGNLECPCLNPQ